MLSQLLVSVVTLLWEWSAIGLSVARYCSTYLTSACFVMPKNTLFLARTDSWSFSIIRSIPVESPSEMSRALKRFLILSLTRKRSMADRKSTETLPVACKWRCDWVTAVVRGLILAQTPPQLVGKIRGGLERVWPVITAGTHFGHFWLLKAARSNRGSDSSIRALGRLWGPCRAQILGRSF